MNTKMQPQPQDNEVIAGRATSVEGDGFPGQAEWERAVPVSFCTDWQGKNADAARETEVRVLWRPETLFVRFVCRYRELVIFADAESDGYKDELWDRDVAEVFIQVDRFGSRHYKEFEVAPNSWWIDLEIFPGGRKRLHSGLRRRVKLDDVARVWTAELALPVRAITPEFDPGQTWRVNFYRCEGHDPNRWYSAWRPTDTAEPNFHVPERFGVMRFR
jgi:alpha-galactosidase